MTDDKAPVELLGMKVIDELIRGEVDYYRGIYEEGGIAAAGQNSSPGGICFKTCFSSAATGTVCAGSLITAQILACGLIAIQSVIGQKFPFRTYESVLLRVIGKTVFLRCIWEIVLPGYIP